MLASQRPSPEVAAGDGRRVVPLTLAISDYDHVRDLVSGAVQPEGIALTSMHMPVEEIFFRFTQFREWDVSELSLAKYCSLRAAGDDSLVGIPAFTSRSFRHSAIFVRADGPVDRPEALAGGRIGVPEWTQTATVYARGLLAREFGVAVEGVRWVQAGTNEPGRLEGVAIEPPPGVSITAEPDHTLNGMLLAGEIDALIAAHPPEGFTDGTGRIVRLFSDHRAVEQTSYERTGVFPIMHLVVLRAEVHERHPWVAMNLLNAFLAAKARSVRRVLEVNAPCFPVPWGPANAEAARRLIGEDFWPYGIEPNRVTLDAFLRDAHAQGVCARRLTPDDLFVPEVRRTFKV